MVQALEAPPIHEQLFVQESFDDTEYFRRYKPDGTLYQSVDCATGLRAHCGFDMQDGIGAPLYAVWDGTAYEINKGPAFGIQTVVVKAGTDQAFFYAHQNRRTVPNARVVRAGQQIGEMGTSGGVQCHLHASVLWPKERGCWMNPGAVLRALKSQLLHPSQGGPQMILICKQDFDGWYRYDGNAISPLTADQAKTALTLGAIKHTLNDTHPAFSLPKK